MALACNVGGIDKTLRIVIGIALAVYAWEGDLGPVARTVLAVIAAIALITAFVGFCPLNRLLGINTCRPSR